MIEEMAKEFCPHYADGKCYYETNEVSTCDCECEFCWAVSVLLKAGYRKIPEGAFVLTGTEKEEHFVDLLTEFDEMGFHPETTVPYPMLYADEWKRRMLYAIGQLRKETAEKFAEMAKARATAREVCFYQGRKYVVYHIVDESFDEICKNITEGKV